MKIYKNVAVLSLLKKVTSNDIPDFQSPIILINLPSWAYHSMRLTITPTQGSKRQIYFIPPLALFLSSSDISRHEPFLTRPTTKSLNPRRSSGPRAVGLNNSSPYRELLLDHNKTKRSQFGPTIDFMDSFKTTSPGAGWPLQSNPKDFSHVTIPPPSLEDLFANNPSPSIPTLISNSLLPTFISPPLDQPPYRRPLKRKHCNNFEKLIKTPVCNLVTTSKNKIHSQFENESPDIFENNKSTRKSVKLNIDSPSTKASSIDPTVASSNDECPLLGDKKSGINNKKIERKKNNLADRVPGIWYDSKRQLWRAVYLHEEKRKTKSFRVKDSDYDQARKMAIVWKQEQITL